MMRKKLLVTTCCILALGFVSSSSCGDKIQVAKTTLSFVALGINTAQGAFDTASVAKRTECLKKGVEGSPEFNKCYEKMAKVVKVFTDIKPRLELAIENAAKYIKAVESGESADYAAAVRESVCLLTEVAVIVPGKWKKQIEAFLALASAYACDKPSTSVDLEQDLKVLKMAHRLMSEILGDKDA